MPTYDYVCEACQHEFEQFQSITSDALKKCPKCGKLKLRRKIGPGAAIVFKGSGFYQTDYRSDSYKQKAAAESKESGGKSESKDTGSKSSAAKSSDSKKSGGSSKSSD